jgi:hypothetical protein
MHVQLSQFVSLAALVVAVLLMGGGCDHAAQRNSRQTTFRIVATDAGFEAPDAVPAGLRHIAYENHGSEIHEAMLVKLPQGMSVDDYIAAVRAGSLFPAGALDYSGPGLTSPGEKVEVWSKLDPGNYIIICWNAGHAKTRAPHPFTVEYAISDDPPPKEDVTLKLLDYRFEFVGQLRKGIQVIRVENSGPSMHEVDIFRLHEGKTMTDVRRWRKEDEGGAVQADAMGGMLDSHDIHRVGWLRKNFTPGRYVLHCEMPITSNSETTSLGTTHADLGMVQEFEITE